MPYGLDDPAAAVFYIVRNSFWIFLVLLAVSFLTSEQGGSVEALPMFLLNVQVFAGETIFIFLAVGWHGLGMPNEDSAIVVLSLTFAGQILAYFARKKLPASSE
jgi:hypothetical protein